MQHTLYAKSKSRTFVCRESERNEIREKLRLSLVFNFCLTLLSRLDCLPFRFLTSNPDSCRSRLKPASRNQTMKVLAAYLLASLSESDAPNKKQITTILSSVGIEADAERVDTLIKELAGKTIAEVIAEGSGKLASMPSSGGAASSGAPAAGGAAPAAAAAAEEKKKDEPKEESDDDMGFGLFD
ncbi:hypothetical protein BASA83_001750 [Batrachochytrium salamandrivorans]|nr:hypothetical protein BASA62_004909 [Batrachochytrium salamandrivorans]KAH9245894.1 hypothetical protein BASA81_016596 [Batrachochytrium salamandrivorans]KAH9275944.1 hypothetical protein BASA83_001750 [Batrachochytrium salamandrivorans]